MPVDEAGDGLPKPRELADPPAEQPLGQLPAVDSAAEEPAEMPSPRPFVDPPHDASVASPIHSDEPSDAVDSRSLLTRWLATGGPQREAIEAELKRRGFDGLRSDVVRLALSDDTAGRVQLVQDLLALPGAGAKAWLMLLADDADAEVRLAAVTLMVTSHDRQLWDKAWQVALHDQDPRVARLADRLRQRIAAAPGATSGAGAR